MRAAVLHGFGDLRIEEVPDPQPGPDDVVLDVACVQPSVTECMLIAGEPVALHTHLAEALAAGPVRFGGHEFCGVVRSVGPAVRGIAVGTRVTAVETVVCGQCPACRRGRSDACLAPEFIGFTRPGALAEQVLVPATCVVPVPPGVTASAAAAVQPLAGALHAHALAAVQPGETVLVIGAGVMGLLALQVARHGNAGLIAISGRSPAKLALANRFGADLVIDASGGADAVLAATREATGGIGVDVVIETAGGAPEVGLAGTETLELAARCARRGGRVVVVSVLPDRAPAPLGLLRERSIALLHPRSGAGGYSPGGGVFDHALRLVARGDVDVDSLVTHRLSGVTEVPKAVEITRDKTAHGAINPAQVVLAAGEERAWNC
ncbi:alcohol dehydrogenase catalytic domain-containing protein [Micromonospora sp. DR5-3]|uniref:zinc-dependent alcohol dehydrogenase n=1 Tax=unclassified Micromonospora TaxID=2617518 RepID=UPI0011D3D062|nr:MULTISPECIES: alcohol dehydrogenase catalytic domain-containing protein [unclassified Micromonospora]MCW3820307.1 alcohol dehydrogenase catalytic domain-containing protein [Micromonospora sp. DR5-3]TYC20117.1 alcohol dehydrogenase catalytic domain-containing protein [Micromonospora sp. MP36]